MLQKRNYERKMAVLNKQFHFQEQSKALCKPNFHSTIVNVSQTEGEEFGHKTKTIIYSFSTSVLFHFSPTIRQTPQMIQEKESTGSRSDFCELGILMLQT